MSMQQIVVTIDSFHSRNTHDLVASNNDYVTKLFQQNLKEDKISKEALHSYYVDYYLSHITCGGFLDFIENFQQRPKVIHFIREGLKALNAKKHLKLFETLFPKNNEINPKINKNRVNKRFFRIQKKENLQQINHDWLMNHSELLIMHQDHIDKHIQEHLQKYQTDKRHIKIIKQLCEIIGEEFIAVTAGDENNIFNRAWHFQTDCNYYYIIERENIVTLYNSFTKKEITQGRLIIEKRDKSLVSNIISQMLA